MTLAEPVPAPVVATEAVNPAAETRSVLTGRSGSRQILALLGPAFVAAVAYVDPGNVAANLQGGARFGYLLVWVLVAATGAAGLVQYLSAKLGVVTGASLAELVRERLSTRARVGYWLQAESVAVATDLAEVVGGAIALRLLFGLPLAVGGLVTGAASMVLLTAFSRRSQRPFERVVTGLLLIIAVGFVAGLFYSPPSPSGALGGLLPRLQGSQSVVLAAAMFGATVMPHVVYLHSALSRDRFGFTAPGRVRRRLLRATRTDVTLAMVVAGGVNIAMLLLAASALRGVDDVDTIDGAHAALRTQFGTAVGVMFAVALLVSGLASSSVGCQAGSVIMQDLLHRRVSLPLRRMVTLVPALLILASGAEPTTVLVISQVALSLGLPFVLIPLLRLTSDTRVMGSDVSPRSTRIVGWVVVGAVVGLNLGLVVGAIASW